MNAILIDFGSTFTKVMVVDVEKRKIMSRSNSPSTVQTDVTIGLKKALDNVGLELSDLKRRKFDYQLSCSSAAGGLKMIALGLVPQLTVEAAKKAALGAGANVLGAYAYELTSNELKQIENQKPDIILLAGGCDGGDEKTVLHNARILAKSRIASPIIVSCNKTVSEEVRKILSENGKVTRMTENVMPELWDLNTEPVKQEIREVFLERIVSAKGLDKVKPYVDILIPTPSATMKAAELLARGVEEHDGLGDLLVIEVGGATTNVYSVSEGVSTQPKTILRGFKEPYVKRTVEGDLGLRYNAKSTIDKIGEREFKAVLRDEGVGGELDIYSRAQHLSEVVSTLPKSNEDHVFDMALSRIAVRIAVKRHSGYLTEIKLPGGVSFIQRGKDLRNVKNVIGSGGGIVFTRNPKRVLSEGLFNAKESLILKPKNPKLYVDRDYVFWAMGLLASIAPGTAYSIMKKSLSSA